MNEKNLPLYWENHLQEKIARIHELQVKSGRHSVSVGFLSDLHWRTNMHSSAPVLERVLTACSIPFYFNGGDTVSGCGICKKEFLFEELSDYRRMYQAVATSFQTWMPQYERTTALYGQVLDVLRAERSLQNQAAMQQFIQEADNAFLDITLPDEQGELQSLSDLRGDVIVLEFSHSMMNQYVEYNFELRELYNKYHKQGLAIYSVSLDNNQLAWEQATEHLPWVTVRADQNASASVLMQYNVQGLPTLFLLDRKGNGQGRYIKFKQLEADIQKYL